MLKFSEKLKYQKMFEEWCSSHGIKLKTSLLNVIVWMEETEEGEELVKRLIFDHGYHDVDEFYEE